jgi:hypothetical protein
VSSVRVHLVAASDLADDPLTPELVLVAPAEVAARAQACLPEITDPTPRIRGRAVALPPPIFVQPRALAVPAMEVQSRQLLGLRRSSAAVRRYATGAAIVAVTAAVATAGALSHKGDQRAEPTATRGLPQHGILESQKTIIRRPAPARRAPRVFKVLRWKPASKAAYYDVQVYRGRTKVFEAWPRTAHLALLARWHFNGRPMRVRRGLYTWYVWPGLGRREKARYGSVLARHNLKVP